MFRYLFTSMSLAFGAIALWPLRAALTAFGILIGVAAVVVTVALGEGTEAAVKKQLSSMGQNTLTVTPQQVQASGAGRETFVPRLTEADAAAIARDAPSVLRVTPVLASRSEASFGGFTVNADVIGTTRDFLAVRAWPVENGEAWSEQAEKTSGRVCLLGSTVARDLFADDDPVGRVLRIGRHPFRVLGVLGAKGQGPFGQEQDNVILMPIGAKRSKLQPTSPGRVDRILVEAQAQGSVDAARREAGAVLRERHGLAEGAEDDFTIRAETAFFETQDRVVGVLRLLLTSIAAISLLVGGIGIMNIMLVSVTERTRDIGIRMAIGATRWDILIQFLTEAIFLSVLGGALGAGVSVAAIFALADALTLPMRPSLEALTLALIVSSGIGIVFGLVPSWRAASLDPIAALGRE